MKKLIITIIGFSILSYVIAQEAIVVPTPTVISVSQPVIVTLSPTQLQGLVAILKSQSIDLPAGIKTLTLKVVPPIMLTGTDGIPYVSNPTQAGGAIVILKF